MKIRMHIWNSNELFFFLIYGQVRKIAFVSLDRCFYVYKTKYTSNEWSAIQELLCNLISIVYYTFQKKKKWYRPQKVRRHIYDFFFIKDNLCEHISRKVSLSISLPNLSWRHACQATHGACRPGHHRYGGRFSFTWFSTQNGIGFGWGGRRGTEQMPSPYMAYSCGFSTRAQRLSVGVWDLL